MNTQTDRGVAGRVVLVACDNGPKQSLLPIAGALSSEVLTCDETEWELPEKWKQYFDGHTTKLLLCGTSESRHGAAVELSARIAAIKFEVPTVVIEDFPGNYHYHEMAPATLLIVENELSEQRYRKRYGDTLRMKQISPARYDYLRGLRPLHKDQYEATFRILWAGQPETDSCLSTLHFLRPFFVNNNVHLYFCAHPRDSGYAEKRYYPYLTSAGVAFTDVTGMSYDMLSKLGFNLVITHFSSLAIQFGFLGVPIVNVLLPNAGGKDLLELKGYMLTDTCAKGAAFCVESENDMDVLQKALHSPEERRKVVRAFDSFYDVAKLQTPLLLAEIESTIANFILKAAKK